MMSGVSEGRVPSSIICKGSLIRSKQTTASIIPAANDKSRLTILFESRFITAPTTPPSPVPTTPEIKVIRIIIR